MATKILHIEDNPGDTVLMRELLRDAGDFQCNLTQTPRLDAGLALPDFDTFDIVLLDLSLPDSQGLETLKRVRDRAPRMPVIILSGTKDEESALQAVQGGAQDYICKSELDERLLRRSIRYALERHGADRALDHERALLRALIDSLPDQIYVKDPQLRFLTCNTAVATLLGKKCADELTGKSDYDFFPYGLAEKFAGEEREVLAGRPRVNREERIAGPWGEDCWLLTTKVPLRSIDGSIEGLVGINRDITERKKAEDKLVRVMADLKRSNEQLKSMQLQLFQAEKFETVGRLAAGVAHEVKNPLAVAVLGLDYLKNVLGNDASVALAVIDEIYEAVRRADSVVGDLLDFSKPRTLSLRSEALNGLVEQTLALLKHEFATKSLTVVRRFDPLLPLLALDPNKLKQVLMNLLLNAFQAMPDFGTLTVATLTGKASSFGLGEGTFHPDDEVAAVRIEDSGSGIMSENIHKIFEPFFTTKGPGQGTGLGLSVARQIVEMHGGILDIRNRAEGGVAATIVLKQVPSVKASNAEERSV